MIKDNQFENKEMSVRGIATERSYTWEPAEKTITIRLIARTPAEARKLKMISEGLSRFLRSKKIRGMKVTPGHSRRKDGVENLIIDFDYNTY